MKKTFAILLFTAFGLAAQAPARTGSTTQTVAKKATAAAPHAITIPKGAVANPNGTYAWTDKDGTNWTYVKTPFGVARTQTSNTLAPANLPADARMFDEGDKVRVEIPTPFGVRKLEMQKSDLTDNDRKLLESQTAATPEKRD